MSSSTRPITDAITQAIASHTCPVTNPTTRSPNAATAATIAAINTIQSPSPRSAVLGTRVPRNR